MWRSEVQQLNTQRLDSGVDFPLLPAMSFHSSIIRTIFIAFLCFIAWASVFKLDQFVRAQGVVFSKSRVQVIQSVDGGVLKDLLVNDGDIVEAGQVLARLDQSRFEASTNEISARIDALQAKIARLRAELTDTEPKFPSQLSSNRDLIAIESALFDRRVKSLSDDVGYLTQTRDIAIRELTMIQALDKTGDVDQSELVRAERSLIDSEAKLKSRVNEFYEAASSELIKAEDELAQNIEILAQRNGLLESSTLRALMPGVVKKVNITTLGAVLKPGEPLLEIIPTGDTLLLEAKVPPKDIADVAIGMNAKIRLDPFDSSVYGTIEGSVVFISGDTIVENNARGAEETFYKAHIAVPKGRITTSVGKEINLIPGMTGQVDIKTGDRTVIKYMLKPIVKTLDSSFGEK